MNINEQVIIRKLIEKHGKDNYSAMARDHVINVHQKTAAQLEKRIELYNYLQNL